MLLEEGGLLESALVDIEFGLLSAYDDPDDTTAKVTAIVSGDALAKSTLTQACCQDCLERGPSRNHL